MESNRELNEARPICITILIVALAAITPLAARAQSPEPQRTPQAQNQAPEPEDTPEPAKEAGVPQKTQPPQRHSAEQLRQKLAQLEQTIQVRRTRLQQPPARRESISKTSKSSMRRTALPRRLRLLSSSERARPNS